MTPLLHEMIARDRPAELRLQAGHRRMVRIARAGLRSRSGQHPIRDALGQGLISLGTRLVDNPPAAEEAGLREAA